MAGTATLGGSLVVLREPPFAPAARSVTQLISAARSNGAFGAVTLTGYLGLGGFASLDYLAGVRLAIGPRSPDFNGDGRVGGDDLGDLITAYFAG